MKITRLFIDTETYSDIDLSTAGVYRYAASPNFELMLFQFRVPGYATCVIDLMAGEQIPPEILRALLDPECTKSSYNATFEIEVLSVYLSRLFGREIRLDPMQWYCTQIHCSMLGLPGKLAEVAKALNLDVQKMKEGKKLISFFCMPIYSAKRGLYRNMPADHPEKWAMFKLYGGTDVDVEVAITERLGWFVIPDMERALFALDNRINRRGVTVNYDMVNKVIAMYEHRKDQLLQHALTITGLQNFNSPKQLKEWLSDETDIEVTTLNKDKLPDILKDVDSAIVTEVLNIRKQLGKTSISKYYAMVAARGFDDKVRGMLQFYGAGRTGRWAGRIVQLHNLPKNFMKSLDAARTATIAFAYTMLMQMYDSIFDTFSQLIRTAFVPSPGCIFGVSDYSAIEAVVISWLAGEEWRLEVFRTHGKIYEAAASKLFGIPFESILNPSKERDYGKVTELSLGYQGSEGAIITMDKEGKIAPEDRLPIVKAWRAINPKIVNMWYDFERAAKEAISNPGLRIQVQYGIQFYVENDVMFIKLPSGRRLSYWQPRLIDKVTRTGKPTKGIVYMGQNQKTKSWGRVDTYGGKLVENVVQAIARDLLATALLRLDAAGINVVMHVHDETVSEIPIGSKDLDKINAIMAQPVEWAPGLPLRAKGYETMYYKKD